MALLRVGELPEEALAAAAVFHAEVVPRVLATLRELHDPVPLPLAGGARGGSEPGSSIAATDPPPTPPASGRGEGLTLIFPPADYTHNAWRLAALQALAREHAPIRINALDSNGEPAIAAALAFLEAAEGVTGQLLELDDTGAGEVVSSPA